MLVMVANNFRKPSIHFVKFYEWICRSPYVKLTEDPFCRQGFRTTLLLGGTLIINPLDFLGWERNGAKRWNIKWHRVVFAVMPFQLKIFRLLCRYPLIHQNLFVCFFEMCGKPVMEFGTQKFSARILDTWVVQLVIGRGSSTNHDLAILEPWEDVTPYSPKTSGWIFANTEMEDHSIILVLKYLTAFQFSLKDDSSILHSGKLTNVPWKETTSEGK